MSAFNDVQLLNIFIQFVKPDGNIKVSSFKVDRFIQSLNKFYALSNVHGNEETDVIQLDRCCPKVKSKDTMLPVILTTYSEPITWIFMC